MNISHQVIAFFFYKPGEGGAVGYSENVHLRCSSGYRTVRGGGLETSMQCLTA